jgi:hypothetical protein
MCHIVQFNPQQRAHFTQIFNRPSSRSRAKLTISGVDFRAKFYQLLYNKPVSLKGRVVKGCGAYFITLVDEPFVALKDCFDVAKIALLRGLNQLLELAHVSPQLALPLHTQQEWLLKRFRDPAQETGCVSAVDQPVIVGKR